MRHSRKRGSARSSLQSGGELALVMTGALANSQQFINATVDCPLPELGLQERSSS